MNARRVLVTGGAGFIGSHLVQRLLERGARVHVLDDLSTGSRENLPMLAQDPMLELTRADLVDCPELPDLVRDSELVFHLAAAVGVRLVVEDPVRSLRTNVSGTERLLAIAAEHGTALVYASSSEVYGKSAEAPLREEDDLSLGPPSVTRWGYACSKALGEWMALARHQHQGLPLVITRFFNAVGPRQTGRYGMVLPRMAARAVRDEPILVYGDGEQTRCFCHVHDTVEALLQLSQRIGAPEVSGRIFNVGNDHEVSMGELAERVRALSGGRSELRFVPYEEVYGPGFEDLRRRVPSVERLESATGFRPRITLETAIEDVLVDARVALDAAALDPSGSR